MSIDKWNVKEEEGKHILENITKKLCFFKKVNKDEMPLLFKKMSKEKGFFFKYNGKNRNINNYIKNRYNNFDNMLKNIKPNLDNIHLNNNNIENNYILKNILINNDKNHEDENDKGPENNPYLFEILITLAGLTGLFFFYIKKK